VGGEGVIKLLGKLLQDREICILLHEFKEIVFKTDGARESRCKLQIYGEIFLILSDYLKY